MWSKNLVELLITKYEQHDNLYDMRNPSYLDRVKRSNSLSAICKELQILNKDVTIDEIKKKIHTLRAQFIKETREIAKSKKCAAKGADAYVPRLWCFPRLQFLKSHCTMRKPDSNISESSDNEKSFVTAYESPALNSEESRQSYARKRTTEHERAFVKASEPTVLNFRDKMQPYSSKRKKLEDRIENLEKYILKIPRRENCYDWLGKQVVFEIGKLRNERIQKDAAWNIQKILRKASIEDAQDEARPTCSYYTPSPESSTKLQRVSSPVTSENSILDDCNSEVKIEIFHDDDF